MASTASSWARDPDERDTHALAQDEAHDVPRARAERGPHRELLPTLSDVIRHDRVEAQRGDPGSMLELYRRALRIRRRHPALAGSETMTWLDAPAGVLAFRREVAGGRAVVCATNTTGRPARLPVSRGRVLLASTAPEGDELAPDSTVWWEV